MNLRQIILKSEPVKVILDKEIARINKNFGNWEAIKSFIIVLNEFTIEGGELTPTLKLKRKIIYKRHEKAILNLYK